VVNAFPDVSSGTNYRALAVIEKAIVTYDVFDEFGDYGASVIENVLLQVILSLGKVISVENPFDKTSHYLRETERRSSSINKPKDLSKAEKILNSYIEETKKH
jgi:hypothetical protein